MSGEYLNTFCKFSLQEGAQIIDKFITDCKELYSMNLPEEQFLKELDKLKQNMVDTPNAYIKALINKE